MILQRFERMLVSLLLVAGASPIGAATYVLPSRCVGGLFYVYPRTLDGKEMKFFTDTGGGLFVTEEVVVRLGLSTFQSKGDSGEPERMAVLPQFSQDATIPPLDTPRGALPIGSSKGRPYDGMLGQAWFRDRVWTFDYARGQLKLHTVGPRATDPIHSVELGFPVDRRGHRETNFPRVQIKVDGESMDMLLDTGATIALAPAALLQLADRGPRTRATSFIVRTIFDRWRRKHPDWPVIDRADSRVGEPMIAVPKIVIGGYDVGPVWFTRREDENFHDFMSSMMDRRVEGAVGGSALRYLTVTVDYPRSVAHFSRP